MSEHKSPRSRSTRQLRRHAPFASAAGALLVLLLAGCASTGATFRSGVGDSYPAHPPYAAGKDVASGTGIGLLPISYQRGSTAPANFDPKSGPGTALGELVAEMNRLGRRNDELVARKAAEIAALDRQLQGLGEALGERQTVQQVVLAGIAGSCAACGTILGTGDRFCSHCGKAVAGIEGDAAEPPPPPPPPPAQLELEAAGADPR